MNVGRGISKMKSIFPRKKKNPKKKTCKNLKIHVLLDTLKMIEQITKLTDDWYKLIGKDHHKDRDCHWYIETKWSYGLPPTYIVRHYGYIIDEVDEKFESYEQALEFLKEFLIKTIEDEINHQALDNNDF